MSKHDGGPAYNYLGDFSATPPEHSRSMSCHACKVSWTGCYDNFQCPRCGEGELPSSDIGELAGFGIVHPPEGRPADLQDGGAIEPIKHNGGNTK